MRVAGVSRLEGGRARVCKRETEMDWVRDDCREGEREFMDEMDGYGGSESVVVAI